MSNGEVKYKAKTPVLDVCCGSRMFWFDKTNPLCTYIDIRNECHTLVDGRKLTISPDIQADFRKLPFLDDQFYHVVFDPPHLTGAGSKGWLALKYGRLDSDWPELLRCGFKECMRVLRPGGTLIFKWNEERIKVSKVIEAIGVKPLYGHRTLQTSKTIWMSFIKEVKP